MKNPPCKLSRATESKLLTTSMKRLKFVDCSSPKGVRIAVTQMAAAGLALARFHKQANRIVIITSRRQSACQSLLWYQPSWQKLARRWKNHRCRRQKITGVVYRLMLQKLHQIPFTLLLFATHQKILAFFLQQ